MAADNLDNVIAGAIAEAREGGLVGETDGVDPDEAGDNPDADEESTDEGTDEGTGEGEEEADTEADAEEGEEGEDDEESEETEEESTEEEEDTEEDTDTSYDDKLAKDLGIKKGKDGKYNWTAPVSKVKNVVQKREAAASRGVLDVVAKAYGVKPEEVTAENLEENLGYTLDLVGQLREQGKTYAALEPLMRSTKLEEVQKFAGALVKLNPLFSKVFSGEAAPERKAVPSAENDPEPQPDKLVKIGDQEVPQYSKKRWEEREAWLRRQITREISAELDSKYEDRLKPFEDMVNHSREYQESQQQLKDRIDDLMTEARTWEHFDDHEDEIQTAFLTISKKNPRLAMEKVMMRAYQQVVIPKLKSNKQKVREEVREENRKAPKSTAVAGGGKKKVSKAVAGEPGSDDRTTSIIRQEIAKARAGGRIK